jgi:adenylate cyclase
MFNYYPEYRERLLDGLRKAGVPEGAGVDIPYREYTQIVSRNDGEYTVAGATKIDASAAKALHEKGVRFIDVRTALAYSRGHIPGAHLLDVAITLTKEKLARIVERDSEIVFYCYGKYCSYSTFASAKAVKWGFSRVYYFAGGLPAWADAGYPVEVGRTQ